MNVLYCGDKNMEQGFIMSAASLGMHTKDVLHIFVITMQWKEEGRDYDMISEACIKKVEVFLKSKNKDSTVVKIVLPEQYKQMINGANEQTRFTPYCMLRLFADKLTEIPDKILYLDTDVICRKNPKELYDTDVSTCDIAGVLDYYGSWLFRKKWYRRDYINSGVMLINMKKIREDNVFETCRELCRDKKMFMPDQSAVNLVAEKKLLPRKYNEQRKLKKDTYFHHFTTSFRIFPWIHTVTVKPWENDKVHQVLGIYEYDDLYEIMCMLQKAQILFEKA